MNLGGARYPLYRRLGGPQSRSGWGRKISPPTGIPWMRRPWPTGGLSRHRQTKVQSIIYGMVNNSECGHNVVNVQGSERTSLVPCTYVSCLLKYYLHYGNLRRANFSAYISTSPLTFRHRASCILGQGFRYSPENAFYIFNQQIYFIIWYLLDRASLI